LKQIPENQASYFDEAPYQSAQTDHPRQNRSVKDGNSPLGQSELLDHQPQPIDLATIKNLYRFQSIEGLARVLSRPPSS
jgi:hypothetical protein